jgi:hypothetical protein
MLVFRVVDLDSQAAAFVRYTRGWSRNDILAYLSQFGLVRGDRPTYPDKYVFVAPCGIRTVFTLTETGDWFFFGGKAYHP